MMSVLFTVLQPRYHRFILFRTTGDGAFDRSTTGKEIGVRKVLGASVQSISLLISKNFVLAAGCNLLCHYLSVCNTPVS
jgi:hypothetical protein